MEPRFTSRASPGLFPLCLLFMVFGCSKAQTPYRIIWGALPRSAAIAYPSWHDTNVGDPAVVEEARTCLSKFGLREGANPRFLIDVTASTTPRHLTVSGAVYDLPQPVVTSGRPPANRAATETLTLVVTDLAGKHDVYRTQWTRRSSGQRAEPRLSTMMCRALAADQPNAP